MASDEMLTVGSDPDWVRYDHPEGMFSISHPRRWRQVSPVSQDACLSCLSSDGSVLMEVVCFTKEQAPGYGERGMVEVIADGIAKYSAFETGMHNGRVIAVNSFPFGGAEACTDVLIAYRDDLGAGVSVDYFVVGSGRQALYVALKTLTDQFAACLPDFERALGTLRTPWMKADGPPNLSGGGRPRAATYAVSDAAMRARIDGLTGTQAPVRRGRFPWLLVGALLAGAIWYLFLRH